MRSRGTSILGSLLIATFTLGVSTCDYPIQLTTLVGHVVAKAEPDECYVDIGVRAPINADGTCDQGVPKVNEAYAWGLTASGKYLWWGTGPNVVCLVLGALLSPFGALAPSQNDSWVCEYGDGPYAPPLPAAIGDYRPPRAYLHNLESGETVDVTPDDPNVAALLGIRGAIANDDVVIMGGPLAQGPGVVLFAFDARTREYLGSRVLPEYANFRKGILHQGVMYLGMGNEGGGGTVLRWRPDVPSNPDYPLGFSVVKGDLDGEAVEFAVHDNHLFVGSWPSNLGGGLGGGGLPPSAGLWMSPEFGPGGITDASADQWQKVWEYSEYDPDVVVAATTGMGALVSDGQKLKWGTMHVPLIHTVAHLLLADALGYEIDPLTAFFSTFRSIAIFEGEKFGTPDQNVEILYGEAQLGAINLLPFLLGGGDPTWQTLPNGMGKTPLYGSSGFGVNPFLNYAWAAGRVGDQVCYGTMDWSFLLDKVLATLPGVPPLPISLPPENFGADLWCFPEPGMPAHAESIDGVGPNFLNYGVRNIITRGDTWYLGMANPMNLRTSGEPRGGWEVIELRDRPAAN